MNKVVGTTFYAIKECGKGVIAMAQQDRFKQERRQSLKGEGIELAEHCDLGARPLERQRTPFCKIM